MKNNERPKLRWPLDIESVKHQDQIFIVLRDRSDVAPQPVVLPQAVLPILSRFDGAHTIQDIVAEGSAFGVTEALVKRIVQELSSFHLIENNETTLRLQQIQDDFSNSPVRKSALSGIVYPSEALALKDKLAEYLAQTVNNDAVDLSSGKIVALISPHIDYQRGWHTYGTAFSALRQVAKPDVIFLIGTAHQPGNGIFHLTKKSFETPLGLFPVAETVVDQLGTLYQSRSLFAEEILHRKEHSLELQLPFIAYRFLDQSLPPIVPILVGSFHQCVMQNQSPMESSEISDFIAALAEVISKLRNSGSNFLLYGGVDLAHVGLHFGDTTAVSTHGLRHLEARDGELIDCIIRGDESQLFAHIAEDGDERRICGFPSMYTMFAALRRAGIGLKGQLIEYRQAVEPKTDCVVTFASACWYERP